MNFKRIKSRLTFWFLIVSMLPLIVVSLVAYQQRVNAIQVRSFDKLLAIRELKLKKINAWLDYKISDIKTLAQDPEVKKLGELFKKTALTQEDNAVFDSVKETLYRHIENHQDYQEIFILNPASGKIELSTNKLFEGEDRSQNIYFKETLRTGELYIKDIFFSKNLHTTSMTFSIPVRSSFSQGEDIVGILVVRMDLNNSIYDIVSDYSGLGKTGETIIVNDNLLALNELRGDRIGPLKIKIESKLAEFLSKKETGIDKAKDYKDKTVLAAYGYIPRTGWGFIVKQDESEINAPVKFMLVEFVITLLISLFTVFIASVFLSKSIASPVLEMTEVSKKIQQGDMSARITNISSDELGFLSQTLNTMSDVLMSQMNVQQASSEIIENMVSVPDMVMFRKVLLEKLISVTHSNMGAYYLPKPGTDMFEICYAIGLDTNEPVTLTASDFEGQAGNALITREISYIKNIPEDTVYKFKTFTGTVIPKEIITIPVIVDNEVRSLITLASINNYPKEVPEILDKVWLTIHVACSNLLANDKTHKIAAELSEKNMLLNQQAKQLQSQTYELRQQSKELQNQNVELEIKRQQVEEANRLKSQFLSTMSHELRTPLNSIMALSRVLIMQARTKLTEEEASYLEIIERNGKDLLALINDILDLSKIEAGKIELHPKSFSAASTVENILERLAPIAAEKKISLAAPLPVTLPEITSDEVRVHQILQNIINNAVKFTEKGGVSVSADYDPENIHIHISDTGIGIAEKHLPHIFDEFRQIDGSSSRRYEGTGLGLAIAYKSAKILGGDITVESTLGKGSKFSVRLPVTWQGTLPYSEMSSPNRMSNQKTERKTILVVDDDPDAVSMICNSLFEEGYHTVSAGSGKEAIEILKRFRPFAITLDVVMPEMDGWEVLQNLKTDPDTKDIPVIIVSVSDNRETGFALGALGYITKPVAKKALISEIYKCVKSHKDLSKPFDILIVDDNDFERKHIKNIIREQGMHALVAKDGNECMALMETHLPDVLILDLVMPNMNGFQVLDKIRSQPDTSTLPVIIVTAKDLTKEDRKKLRGNVSSIVEKSETTSTVLLEEIKNILAEIEMKESASRNKNPDSGTYEISLQDVIKTDEEDSIGKQITSEFSHLPAFSTMDEKKTDTATILVIEDNPDNMITIRAVLKNQYNLIETWDGEEGLKAAHATRPDIILTDMALPKLDGMKVADRIKKDREICHIPVIALTAQAMKEDREKILSAGLDDYISKPFSPEELLSVIHKWLPTPAVT